MPVETGHLLAGDSIPDAYGLVGGSGHNPCAPVAQASAPCPRELRADGESVATGSCRLFASLSARFPEGYAVSAPTVAKAGRTLASLLAAGRSSRLPTRSRTTSSYSTCT